MKSHLSLTAAQARRLGMPRARARSLPAGSMNRGEQRYAAEILEPARLGGEIARWDFEAIKLRLAPRTFYTPDFLITRSTGELEFVEIKGRKGDGFWAEEDAVIKVKVSAQMFPQFHFRIAWPAKGGGWQHRDVG